MEETLMLGKIEGRRRGGQRVRRLDSITDSMGRERSRLQETVEDGEPAMLQVTGSRRARHDLATEQQLVAGVGSPRAKAGGMGSMPG